MHKLSWQVETTTVKASCDSQVNTLSIVSHSSKPNDFLYIIKELQKRLLSSIIIIVTVLNIGWEKILKKVIC